jgi:hypothetical protein
VDAVSNLLLDHGAVVVHCATRISLCFRISLSIIGMFFFFRVLDCILISILFSEFLRVCLVVTRVRITIRGLDTAGSRAPGPPDTIRRNSATHPRSYQAMSL